MPRRAAVAAKKKWAFGVGGVLCVRARVDKRKRCASVRAVERAAKCQCKTDERQTEALRAKMRNWAERMFEAKRAISVLCKAALVEECLKDACATAKSAGEKLPWLECLPKGIRESERLAAT